MSEDNNDSIEVKTPFFSSKIAGKNLTLRDIILFFVFIIALATFMFVYTHAESADKSTQALLKEIQQSNKATLDAQKNTAYHACRQSCLLEQAPDKRDGTQCERICTHLKP